MTSMSARELNRDVSEARRNDAHAPVVITDRGEPSFVLFPYRGIPTDHREPWKLGRTLSMDDDLDIEFEPVRLHLQDPEL
ncbi:type II toxin-antitoxin system prevent-host-death family antitoxin [Yimella sp. cx-573]|nr:type II toxin-antitoxin system prevent-host-death family antitoxin [Yimella sp. cx-573]